MSEFYVPKFGILNIKDLWAGVLFSSALLPLFPSSVIFVFTVDFPNVSNFPLSCPLQNSQVAFFYQFLQLFHLVV